MTWVLIAIVAFFLLRGGAGGGAVDGILDLLRGLLNRPKPEPAKNFSNPHDCCKCVIDLAKHLDKAGHADVAATLRDLLPKLAEGHKHE